VAVPPGFRRGVGFGYYALGLLWAAALLARVDGHLADVHRTMFLAESRRLLRQTAQGVGERWTDRSWVAERVRGLAGEPETRFGLLLDRRGRPLAVFGAEPSEAFARALGRGLPDQVYEEPGAPRSLAFAAEVRAGGRRVGTLAWGRWTPEPAPERERERRALVAAFLWWAAAGALVLYWGGRGTPGQEPVGGVNK